MKLVREADDFDWIKEIPGTLNTYGRQYIDLDGLTPSERCQLQQLILDNGIYWSKNRSELIPEYCHSETVKAYSLYNGELYISTMDYEEFLKLVNKYEGQDSEVLYTKGEDLLKGTINESDDWGWVKEIPGNIPLNDLEEDKQYKYVPNKTFYGALEACGATDRIPGWITHVDVVVKFDNKIPYQDIYCNHERRDMVDYVRLRIHDDEGNSFIFAVTEGMGEFYPLPEQTINESDDFYWVDEVPSFDFRRGLYVIDLKTATPKEKFEIQKQLLDMGVKWAGFETHPVKQYSDSEIKLYVIRDGRMRFSRKAKDIDAFMKEHFRGMPYTKLTKENFI